MPAVASSYPPQTGVHPPASLSVVGDARIDSALRFCGPTSERDWEVRLEGHRLQMDRTATLGLGSDERDARFHGSLYVPDGRVQAKLFHTLSDARTKQSGSRLLSDNPAEAMRMHSALMDVPVRRFRYVDGDDPDPDREWHTGVVAQELGRVMPSAVKLDSGFLGLERPVLARVVPNPPETDGALDCVTLVRVTEEPPPERTSETPANRVMHRPRVGDEFRATAEGAGPSRPVFLKVLEVFDGTASGRDGEARGETDGSGPDDWSSTVRVRARSSFPLPPLSRLLIHRHLKHDVHSVDTNEILFRLLNSVQNMNRRLRTLETLLWDQRQQQQQQKTSSPAIPG